MTEEAMPTWLDKLGPGGSSISGERANQLIAIAYRLGRLEGENAFMLRWVNAALKGASAPATNTTMESP